MHIQQWLSSAILIATFLVSGGVYAQHLNFHTLRADELSIELMDGSQWEISDADLTIANTWRIGDHLTICPDYAWFSKYNYSIYNKDCQTKLRANLTVGPFTFGPLSNWIIRLDQLSSHLYLQDGTMWCIKAQDEKLLAEWKVNDHIILGHEDNLWSHYPDILINIDMNQHVRARQYGHRLSQSGSLQKMNK